MFGVPRADDPRPKVERDAVSYVLQFIRSVVAGIGPKGYAFAYGVGSRSRTRKCNVRVGNRSGETITYLRRRTPFADVSGTMALRSGANRERRGKKSSTTCFFFSAGHFFSPGHLFCIKRSRVSHCAAGTRHVPVMMTVRKRSDPSAVWRDGRRRYNSTAIASL